MGPLYTPDRSLGKSRKFCAHLYMNIGGILRECMVTAVIGE